MNRSQFLKAVAARADAHKRDVEHVWEKALEELQESVKRGEKVAISGFGIFKQRVRKAGERINPQTGEKIRVAARKIPRFTPAKPFKLFIAGEAKLVKKETKPMALAAAKAAPKKAAAKAAPKKAVKKAAPKKAVKKAAPKKKATKR